MAALETLPRTRCLVHLLLMALFAPLSLLFILLASATAHVEDIAQWCKFPWQPSGTTGKRQRRRRRPISQDSPTVMLTGGKMTKSLHFARWFWRAGYKVVMVETEKYWLVGSRFSRSLHAFETVLCPREDEEGYITGLVSVAKKHRCDFFVPVSSPVSAISDSKAKPLLEELGCRVLHFGLEECQRLDDKHEFSLWAQRLQLPSLESSSVPTEETARSLNRRLQAQQEEGKKYILKNLEYDPVHRLDLFLLPCPDGELEGYLKKLRRDGNAIESARPWQLQRFVRGREFTSFAVLRAGGAVRALTTAESSASQLNYEHVDVEEIAQWVRTFAERTNLTGQLCFDFIQDDETKVWYPIECNPRVHSQCAVFLDNLEFGDAVLAEHFPKTLYPSTTAPPVFWLYNEVMKCLPDAMFNYGAASSSNQLWVLMKRVCNEREANFDPEDPMPFFMLNHFQLPGLLLDTMIRGTPWKKLDFAIGKVVELNGD